MKPIMKYINATVFTVLIALSIYQQWLFGYYKSQYEKAIQANSVKNTSITNIIDCSNYKISGTTYHINYVDDEDHNVISGLTQLIDKSKWKIKFDVYSDPCTLDLCDGRHIKSIYIEKIIPTNKPYILQYKVINISPFGYE